MCSALQGCYSQGDTYEEAFENIRNAIRLHIEEITEGGDTLEKVLIVYIGHFFPIVTDTSVQKFQVCALMEIAACLVIQIGKKTQLPNSTHSAPASAHPTRQACQ